MKVTLSQLLLVGSACASLLTATVTAQTADQLVTEGRGFLSSRNITNANARFASALALNPNHEAANVLHAATRVLNLPLQPAGAAFLTRLGVSTLGRNIYNWTARTVNDAEGIPLAPTGVSAQELPWQLRTNALPELQGALQSLARITNPDFTLSLTAAETTGDAVTLDQADVLVLRAALHFLEYLCYTLHAQNLDAQLTALRALSTNNNFSMETLLTQYPALFTYNTTNDLAAAQAAFVNLVDRYNEASDKMRLRMAQTRLFNLDDGSLDQEIGFRTRINELRQSLFGPPVVLSEHRGHSYDQFVVDLKTHFSGQHSIRSQLPVFQGSRFGQGSLPEPVLGGLFPAFSRDLVENYLLNRHTLLGNVVVGPIKARHGIVGAQVSGTGFTTTLRGQQDRGYTLQFNTNLTNSAGWQPVGGSFFAEGNTVRLEDPGAVGAPRRFYRVVEHSSGILPAPTNNNFANRITLTGFPAIGRGYTTGASTEAGEPSSVNGRGRTVWWNWTAPSTTTVGVFTGFPNRAVQLYTGTSVGALSPVSQTGGNQVPQFFVLAGATYVIRVDDFSSYNYTAKGFPLVITAPMALSVAGVTSGASLSAPANLTITATVTSPTSPVTEVGFYGAAETTLKTPPYTLSLTNLLPGNYYLSTYSENQLGMFEYAFVNFSVTGPTPPNDNFASRFVLSGGIVVAESYTGGATFEVGEPNHSNYPFGGPNQSVWWEWVAPKTGLVTFSTRGSAAYGDSRSSVHGHLLMLEVVFGRRQKSASFGIVYLFVVTEDVRRTTRPKTNSNIAMTNRLF